MRHAIANIRGEQSKLHFERSAQTNQFSYFPFILDNDCVICSFDFTVALRWNEEKKNLKSNQIKYPKNRIDNNNNAKSRTRRVRSRARAFVIYCLRFSNVGYEWFRAILNSIVATESDCDNERCGRSTSMTTIEQTMISISRTHKAFFAQLPFGAHLCQNLWYSIHHFAVTDVSGVWQYGGAGDGYCIHSTNCFGFFNLHQMNWLPHNSFLFLIIIAQWTHPMPNATLSLRKLDN